MLRPRRLTASGLACVLAIAGAAPAIAQGIGQGFELERAGRTEEAATAYEAALRGNPTDLAALLGLERVLAALNRTDELLPRAARAATLDTASDPLRGLLVRACVVLGQMDSAATVTERWARGRPKSEAPWRELGTALSDGKNYARAREAFLAGRKALGRPAAFAAELAELAQRTGDWEIAASEWGLAVTATPTELPNAAAELGDAPEERRDRIARTLTASGASQPRLRLAAELVLQWGDPTRAWSLFEQSLGPPSATEARALYRFADLAAELETPAAWRVRGHALRKFADMVPALLAVRARSDAARAYLAGGDPEAARVQLSLVADDPTAPPEAKRLAQTTLVRAFIQGGQLDSAAAYLSRATLGEEERNELRYALARGWIRQGALDQADTLLAGDSSVDASALRGKIALYRGDLQVARVLLIAAGPYAGDRHEATERSALVALIVQLSGGKDRVPELGAALLTLARGDSATATADLWQAARLLPVEHGRADVLLLAGRVAARPGGDDASAASLFDEAIRTGGARPAAAAAELEWARLFARQGDLAAAREHLEHLILSYPESAVVPEARRELERVKGAIPRS
jgi:tetratricopeptide (TPR) repeat protein